MIATCDTYREDTSRKFSTQIQKLCGGCELSAMLYSHFKYWAGRNAKRGHNEHEGHFWTYDTLEFLADKFGKTPRQIRYAVGKLKTAGLIITRRAYGWINKVSKLVNWYTIPGLFTAPEEPPAEPPEEDTPKEPGNPDTTGAELSFRSDNIVTSIYTLPLTEKKHTYPPAPAVELDSLISEAEELITTQHGTIPPEDQQWMKAKAEDLLTRMPRARLATLLTMVQTDFSGRLKTLFRSAKFSAARDELSEAKLDRIRATADKIRTQRERSQPAPSEFIDRSWADKYDFDLEC